MAVNLHTHDNEIISLNNCIEPNKASTSKLRLPKKSWQIKLSVVNEQIQSKWHLKEQNIPWILSINGIKIHPSDIQKFGETLSTQPPPIIINIERVN